MRKTAVGLITIEIGGLGKIQFAHDP